MEIKDDRLAVDTREAARLLGLSPRTVQNYLRTKMLPSRKFGRRTLILVRSLQAFVRSDQPSPQVETNRVESDR
jgi:excisionase family DNA binding protein